MHRALLALLLLPLLAPPAAAWTPPSPRAEVEPFDGPVAPLAETATTNIRFTGACEQLRLDVVSAPAWADVTFTPHVVTLGGCGGYEVVGANATLVVKLDASAPAFRPANVTFTQSTPRHGTAEHVVQVEADYFSILEVNAREPIRQVKPGENATFVVEIANRGNGAAWVAVEAQDANGGLVPAIIPPFLLESAQQGGTEISRNLTLDVGTTGGAGYVNQVGTVTYRVRSWSADDPNATGDTTMLSLLVPQKGLDAPAPAPLALVAGAPAASVLLRRRRA